MEPLDLPELMEMEPSPRGTTTLAVVITLATFKAFWIPTHTPSHILKSLRDIWSEVPTAKRDTAVPGCLLIIEP
jgi:hypothetical protein